MASTLVCPLLSMGSQIDMICIKERCAWYLPNCGACSAYVLAHDASLDIRQKQQAVKKTQ